MILCPTMIVNSAKSLPSVSLIILSCHRFFLQFHLHPAGKENFPPASLSERWGRLLPRNSLENVILHLIGAYTLYKGIMSVVRALCPATWDLLNDLSKEGHPPGAEARVSFPQNAWANEGNAGYGMKFSILTKENGGKVSGWILAMSFTGQVT